MKGWCLLCNHVNYFRVLLSVRQKLDETQRLPSKLALTRRSQHFDEILASQSQAVVHHLRVAQAFRQSEVTRQGVQRLLDEERVGIEAKGSGQLRLGAVQCKDARIESVERGVASHNGNTHL